MKWIRPVVCSERCTDPVDMFPMLDFDMDLNSGEVASPVTLRIFPSQHDQLIACNVRQFMSPDSSREQALQYVKEFLKKGGHGGAKPIDAKVTTKNVTESFYSFTQDSFDKVPTTAPTPTQMPTAP